MNNYQSLSEALDDLRKRGYNADFATQTVCLYCGDLDLRLDPEDFHVDEHYKFTNGSVPGGEAVLYAISSTSGVNGTLLDTNGSYYATININTTNKIKCPSLLHNNSGFIK